MSNFKDKFFNFINRIFNKDRLKELPPSRFEALIQEIKNSGIIKDFESIINSDINMQKIEVFYRQTLGNDSSLCNMPLASRLSEKQTIELARAFFSSLDSSLSIQALQILDNTSKDFTLVFEQYGLQTDNNGNPREGEVNELGEVYCPRRGDLRDLYEIVHQITHTFDLESKNPSENTNARELFGEVVPQCMDKLLDNFLMQLSDSDTQNYGLNKEVLQQDIKRRQISTFLSMKENLRLLTNHSGNEIENLKYILAQIYSYSFMKIPPKDNMSSLLEFIKNIQNNSIENCSQAFGINLSNKLKTQFTIQEIINHIKNINGELILQEKLQEILQKSSMGKNFVETFGGQNIHIILETKIPFVLVSPLSSKNGQTLVMESNNLETSILPNLLTQALETAKTLNDILQGNCPILVPILPSPSPTAPYYQQLSAECFQNGQRPDLDIVEVIAKAKEIIENTYNIELNDKIFLNGYSSSGCFAQRFCLIHPELIDTACIGGASGSIPIPDTSLDYPLGIKNYEELFGQKFNLEEYRHILFNYYVGSLECKVESSHSLDENGNLAPMHDMSYFDRSVPPDVGTAQRKYLGQDMFTRAKKTVQILKNMGISISHTVFPNIAHNDNEAITLRRKNPLYKKAQGVYNTRAQMISSTFNQMIQRNENIKNYTLDEHN